MRKRLIGERYGTRVQTPSWTCPLVGSVRYCMVRSRRLSLSASGLTSLFRIAVVLRISSCLAMHHCHTTKTASERRDRVEQQSYIHGSETDGFWPSPSTAFGPETEMKTLNTVSGSAGLIRKRFMKKHPVTSVELYAEIIGWKPMVLHPGLRKFP